MTEIISGLHSCKKENAPVIGEVKTFVIEQRTGKTSGVDYLKIKSASPEYGGEPYKILKAEPTGFTDKYNNISFNLDIEKTNGGDATRSSPTTPTTSNAAQKVQSQSAAPYSMLDERQRAIIRQHSQAMSLEVLNLKWHLGELHVEDLTPTKLTALANFFDADVTGAATNE